MIHGAALSIGRIGQDTPTQLTNDDLPTSGQPWLCSGASEKLTEKKEGLAVSERMKTETGRLNLSVVWKKSAPVRQGVASYGQDNRCLTESI